MPYVIIGGAILLLLFMSKRGAAMPYGAGAPFPATPPQYGGGSTAAAIAGGIIGALPSIETLIAGSATTTPAPQSSSYAVTQADINAGGGFLSFQEPPPPSDATITDPAESAQYI